MKMWTKVCVALVAVIAAICSANLVSAADVGWDNGAGTNNWHDAANWAGDVLPGAGDTANSPANAQTIVDIVISDADVTVANLNIGLHTNGSTTLTNGANLNTGSFLIARQSTSSFTMAPDAGTITAVQTNVGDWGAIADGTLNVQGGLLDSPNFNVAFTDTTPGQVNHSGGEVKIIQTFFVNNTALGSGNTGVGRVGFYDMSGTALLTVGDSTSSINLVPTVENYIALGSLTVNGSAGTLADFLVTPNGNGTTTFSLIPEPTSLALLAFGSIAALGLRRRRR